MGKKGGKKASADASPALAAAPVAATSWAEALELDPKKKEEEERKLRERQAKAEASAKAQAKQNEKNQWWEKERQKEVRQQDRVDRQWQQEASAAKQKALKEGVLEAQDWGDGSWWVELGKGKWQEVQGQYFCPHCEKHLNDCTLKSHIDSDAHQRKVAWAQGGGDGSGTSSASASAKAQAAPVAAPQQPPKRSSGQGQGQQLEDWQEMTPEGFWRCIPCGKVIDECHIQTADHINRLHAWLEQSRKAKSNYPAPALPYLADIPEDENDPNSARWPKCLLCNKWCQDETSHTGTHGKPEGSKEHQKNLRNYLPGTPWYEEKVTQVRNRWHPPAKAAARAPPKPPTAAPWAAASAPSSAPAPPPPSAMGPSVGGPPLPRDWFSATDPKTGMLYYYNRNGERQWERPSGGSTSLLAAAGAPAASASSGGAWGPKAAWGKAVAPPSPPSSAPPAGGGGGYGPPPAGWGPKAQQPGKAPAPAAGKGGAWGKAPPPPVPKAVAAASGFAALAAEEEDDDVEEC